MSEGTFESNKYTLKVPHFEGTLEGKNNVTGCNKKNKKMILSFVLSKVLSLKVVPSYLLSKVSLREADPLKTP